MAASKRSDKNSCGIYNHQYPILTLSDPRLLMALPNFGKRREDVSARHYSASRLITTPGGFNEVAKLLMAR